MGDGGGREQTSIERRLAARLQQAKVEGRDVESGAPLTPEAAERVGAERAGQEMQRALETMRRGMDAVRRTDVARHAADLDVYGPIHDQLQAAEDGDDAALDAAAHLVEEAEARYDAVERAAANEGEIDQTTFFRVEPNRKEVQPAAVQPARRVATPVMPRKEVQQIRRAEAPEPRMTQEQVVLEQWRQYLVNEQIVDEAGTGLASGYTAEQFGLTQQHLDTILRNQQQLHMRAPSPFEQGARRIGA